MGDYRPSHVGLCVRDLDRSLRFFCDGLGFEQAETFELDSAAAEGLERSLEVPGPVRIVSQFIQNDTMKIELLHFVEPGVGGTPSATRNQLGLTHLSFYVDDLDAATRHLVEHGATVIEETRASPGIDLLFLADPDGVRVELMALPRVTAVPDVELTGDDERFRRDVAAWLADHVVGDYAELKGRGGPGDEDVGFDVRVAWEHELGKAGFIGLGWPEEFGGRGATLAQQVVWAEEYTRAQAPARVNHMGENLLAPTLIAYGTAEQQERFLPGIRRGDERWCQGYSEPNAGSDLANVATRARLEGGEWLVNGQKVWTSLADVSHWCFVVARTDPDSTRHHGLSFLLVPMDQPGVEVRPIVQITGGGEFNEVFFDDARTEAGLIIGDVNDGWRIAMGLLGFERGVSTLAQQVGFERELEHVLSLARTHGRADEPVLRQRLVDAWIGLRLMKWNAMRSMAAKGVPGPEASISKLFWGSWHRDLGNLMVDVLGPDGLITEGAGGDALPYELTLEQKLFLFSRSDTIYGGSNEIQRNVLGERVLGLPRDPR